MSIRSYLPRPKGIFFSTDVLARVQARLQNKTLIIMILANFSFKEHCVCYAKQYLYSPVLHFVSNSDGSANTKQDFLVQKISRKIGLRHAMYFFIHILGICIYLMILIFQRLQYRKLIVIKYAKKLSEKAGKILVRLLKK